MERLICWIFWTVTRTLLAGYYKERRKFMFCCKDVGEAQSWAEADSVVLLTKEEIKQWEKN